MRLMKGEKVLLEINDRRFILTTHRLRYLDKTGVLYSVMLEEVSSCQAKTSHHPFFLVVSFLFLLIAILFTTKIHIADAVSGSIILIMGLTLFLLPLLLYFQTRASVLAITFCGGSFRVGVKGRDFRGIEEIIDVLEEAKDRRFLERGRREQAEVVDR